MIEFGKMLIMITISFQGQIWTLQRLLLCVSQSNIEHVFQTLLIFKVEVNGQI